MASLDKPFMGEHDPYQNMERAIIRPKDIPRSKESARGKLFDAEQAASKSPSKATRSQNSLTNGSARSLRNLEQSQPSIFRNNVRGRNESSDKKGKKKTGFKKYLPLTAIASFLIALVALFYGASTLLGSAFNSLITRATDVQFTSYLRRNTRIFKHAIEASNPVQRCQLKIYKILQKLPKAPRKSRHRSRSLRQRWHFP